MLKCAGKGRGDSRGEMTQAGCLGYGGGFVVCVFLLMGACEVCAEAPITALAMTVDGKQVVLGWQGGIEICTLPELTVVVSLPTELEHVHDLKFSLDGHSLLAAGGSPAESGRVEVWSWPKRERVREVDGHSDVVYRVAWAPDGSQWLTCSGDGKCLVISAATGERLAEYVGHSRGVLAGSYLDHRTIATAGIDQTIRLWNSEDGAHTRTLDNHVGTVNDIALRPKQVKQAGEVIATVSEDRTVRLWQPEIGRLIRFVRLGAVPRCLVWSSDGLQIFVGCNDGRVRIIDADSMTIAREVEGNVGRIHELAVDSAAGYLVTAGEAGCRVVSIQAK